MIHYDNYHQFNQSRMRKTKLLKAFKNQTNGYLMVTLIE